MLRIADQLTDNASGFKLYFSDVSLDNYAVDPVTERVFISDAENIVVVDEQHLRSKGMFQKRLKVGVTFLNDNIHSIWWNIYCDVCRARLIETLIHIPFLLRTLFLRYLLIIIVCLKHLIKIF